MLDFMLLFSKIFNTFSLVKIILSLCSREKSQEIQKPVSDLQSICCTGIYLDGSDSIRQELCVLIQHYYSDPKRKMRPTAGHKLCQTLNANLHPSVFSIKSRRTISRTVVLVLARDCQKRGRKLPAVQRLWKCVSVDCRCDGQCWTQALQQWGIHMEQGVWKTFPVGRMSCFASCLHECPAWITNQIHPRVLPFPCTCHQESASPKVVVKALPWHLCNQGKVEQYLEILN